MKKQILFLMAFAFSLLLPVNALAQSTTIYLPHLLATHDDLLGAHGDMDFASVTRSNITGLSGCMRGLFWNSIQRTMTTQPDAITAVHDNFNETLIGEMLAQLMLDFLPRYYDRSVLDGQPTARMITRPSVGRGGNDGVWEITFRARDGYRFFTRSSTYTFNVVILTEK